MEPGLAAVWGSDWEGAVRVLDDFLGRFPDFGLAREKQYAALVALGESRLREGDVPQGVGYLEQARDLLPERGEAVALLLALTPTPTPEPTATPRPQPVATARPAPTRTPVPAAAADGWVGRWTGRYSGTTFAWDRAAVSGCGTRPVSGSVTALLSREGNALRASFTFFGAALGYLSCNPLDHTAEFAAGELAGPLGANVASYQGSGRRLTLNRISESTLSGTYLLDDGTGRGRRIDLTFSLARQP